MSYSDKESVIPGEIKYKESTVLNGLAKADASFDFKPVMEKWKDSTFRELTTGTSGLSLAQLVASAAEIQMRTLADARKICRTELVPERGGMVYHFQFAQAVAGSTLTEGTDATAVDITLADKTATLNVWIIRTDISDIVSRQAGVNLSQLVGEAHGNAMIEKVNSDIYTALKAATTTNTAATVGAANDGLVATLGWSAMFKARQLVASQRGMPNRFITSPLKMYELLNQNLTNIQFYSALQDYITSGHVGQIMGMDITEDPVYGETFTGTTGEQYATVAFGGHAIGYAVAEEVQTAIQRWEPQVGFRVVTHLTAKSTLVAEPWVTNIHHL
jgi:phage baseplate assembly protein W